MRILCTFISCYENSGQRDQIIMESKRHRVETVMIPHV